MKLIVNGRDFTALCTELTLEDNIYAASAVLTAQVVFENHDGYLPPIFAYCGNEVVLEDKGEIFRGNIIEVNVAGKECVFEITAVEKSNLLAKNDVFGIFSSSAAANGRKVLSQVGLSAGNLPAKTCRSFASYGGMTAKEVIDMSYGEGYFVDFEGGKVHIRKVGEGEIALSGSMIFDIRSAESIADMVNMVSLTNSKHRVIYNTKSNDDIEKYGKYHKYRQITRNESSSAVAKEMLQGMKRSAKILMGGELGVKKGRMVEFNLARFGLEGRYAIESVRHSVSGGVHTTEIEVKHESLL